MQGIGNGFKMLMYCRMHLTQSDIIRARPEDVLLRDPGKLDVFAPTFLAAYFAPMILMAYPFADPETQQWFGAV
jgi:hypothetical protein